MPGEDKVENERFIGKLEKKFGDNAVPGLVVRLESLQQIFNLDFV